MHNNSISINLKIYYFPLSYVIIRHHRDGIHYINTLLKWYIIRKAPVHPVEFAKMIMDSVMGVDLNLVAVITEKVNYLLQVYRLLTIYRGFLAEQPAIPILRLDLLSLHLSHGTREKQKLLVHISFVVKQGQCF
jgi:hypothetical protein